MSSLFRVVSVAATGLLVLTLLMAACATQPAPASAPSTAAPLKPAAPQVGGALVFAQEVQGANFDPHDPGVIQNNYAMEVMGTALVTKDLATGEPIPWLAESWKVSDDGLTYEFRLKKNIKWHDGTPLTAKDYVYTIERARAKKSPFPATTFGEIVSQEAPDDYTLRLKLREANATFLSTFALANVFAQPVPKHAIDQLGDKFGSQPVLSGPYKFKEWQPGVKVVLERNPDYNWGPSWQPGPAYIQNVEFRVVKEYATILSALEAGEVDIAIVQPKDVDRLKATGKVQIIPLTNPGLDSTVLFRSSQAPWNDVRVRQAVNLAVDRQAMIKVVAPGYGVEMRGPIPPSSYGYWPGVEKIGYGFDLNRAKALMKEAGYAPAASGILEKDGKPMRFTMKTTDSPPYNQLAPMVKDQMRALGIDLDIQVQPRPELTADAIAGKYELALMGIPQAVPDARGTLRSYFQSSKIGASNLLAVNDPQLDALIDAALRTTDTAKSMEYAAQAQKLVVEKAYSVPMFQNVRLHAVSSRVKGLERLSDKSIYPFIQWNIGYIEGGR